MQKDDVIYRQVAIDAIDECFKKVVRARNMSAYEYDSAYAQGEIDAYVTAIDAVKALPSTQPNHVADISKKAEWILCSERLPKKTGYYLTTNEYKVVHEDYYWGSGCFEKAKKYQCEVVAWMPMPISPYCGV